MNSPLFFALFIKTSGSLKNKVKFQSYFGFSVKRIKNPALLECTCNESKGRQSMEVKQWHLQCV